jgi:hypothetical protein
MIKKFSVASILFLITAISYCQNVNEYQVFALKYTDGQNISAQRMVAGANPKDSIRVCNMFWLLKGEKGRNILVDVGFIDTTKSGIKNYVSPELVLHRILIASDAIWFYYNYKNLLPATLCLDPKAYVEAMKRMTTLVTNPDLIIPGHDDLVFSKFPEISKWIVKIGH